ncbi:MAG: TonB family protein [Janthinobacterium lividum]
MAARLEQLPAWQVAQGAPSQLGTRPDFIVLPLALGAPAAAPAYSDELSTFPVPVVNRRPQPSLSLLSFLQMQTRYPSNDLRQGTQGTVYAYFEVSETGAVEQRRIVGSVSGTLDEEVLRVLQLVPSALAPPRQQGRPVRVAYVLPLQFKVQ